MSPRREPDREMERSLVVLAQHVEFPPTPDLASSVAARLAEAPAPGRPRRPIVWTRRAIVLAAALIVLAAGIAVASYFGIRGIRIRIGETPTPSPSAGALLNLGQWVGIEEARSRVPFPVRVPADLGDPDQVYLNYQAAGGQVTLFYRPRPDVPEVNGAGAGLLLFEFQGSFSRASMDKFVRQDQIRTVTVDGWPGFWIEGAHTIGYTDSLGGFAADDLRLSGNALLWHIGSVTLRLESALPMTDAIRIASSVR